MNEVTTEQQELETQPVEGKQQAAETQQAKPVTTEETKQEEDAETLRKRLADTQAWGHQNAQELAATRRELDAIRLRNLQAEVQPEVLGVVDKAIEARELRVRQEQAAAQQKVMDAVNEAIPDLQALQVDPEFSKVVAKHADEVRKLGKDPMSDPIAAIRAVNAARSEYVQAQARKAAEAAANGVKTSKLSAMAVPGAGAQTGARSVKDYSQDADAVRNMSDAEFAKMRSKALGF